MTEPTKEKGIKEVDVFVQDNDLIFQLREKGNGATWDCKVFSQLMPFGVREGAFLKSFTATYIPKSNQVKLDQEIKTLKEQLEKAEKVIEFYGDKDNWYCEEFSYSDWCDCITKTDISPELIGGKLARQYLEDKQGDG